MIPEGNPKGYCDQAIQGTHRPVCPGCQSASQLSPTAPKCDRARPNSRQFWCPWASKREEMAQNAPQLAQIDPNLLNASKWCKCVRPGALRIYSMRPNDCKCFRVLQYVPIILIWPGCCQIRLNLPKLAQMGQNAPKCAPACPNSPKCCQTIQRRRNQPELAQMRECHPRSQIHSNASKCKPLHPNFTKCGANPSGAHLEHV